ncbi:hypothetical protein CASFOL_027161 [Castilleja foliolosa]|uniref:Uncharacterized protein n=1 Tax=Castilleja foliolosa TaxID=1961234 RepID=A0ABD3CE06_9LAMI
MLGLLTLNVFAPSMFTSRTRGEKGLLREVDIKNLGSIERKNLVDRLLKTDEEEGSEKFLMKLKKRIHRVGLDLPTIEVRFEQLSVDADAYVGRRAMPTEGMLTDEEGQLREVDIKNLGSVERKNLVDRLLKTDEE